MTIMLPDRVIHCNYFFRDDFDELVFKDYNNYNLRLSADMLLRYNLHTGYIHPLQIQELDEQLYLEQNIIRIKDTTKTYTLMTDECMKHGAYWWVN
jgi:hypothetical protein